MVLLNVKSEWSKSQLSHFLGVQGHLAEAGPARRPDSARKHEGQLLGDGRNRPLRPLLRDPLRPHRQVQSDDFELAMLPIFFWLNQRMHSSTPTPNLEINANFYESMHAMLHFYNFYCESAQFNTFTVLQFYSFAQPQSKGSVIPFPAFFATCCSSASTYNLCSSLSPHLITRTSPFPVLGYLGLHFSLKVCLHEQKILYRFIQRRVRNSLSLVAWCHMYKMARQYLIVHVNIP
jgi:hypothetical protein